MNHIFGGCNSRVYLLLLCKFFMYNVYVYFKTAFVDCTEPASETTFFNKRIRRWTVSKEIKIISVGHTSLSGPYRVEILFCFNVCNLFCLFLQCKLL